MDGKLKSGIVDVFFANLLSLILGLVTGFIMPKMLSVDTYAGIKTYQLYVSYIGFYHLGFVDGIYLKYGGINFASTDRIQLKRNHDTLIIFQFFMSVGTFVLGMIFVDRALIFFAISIIPLNCMNFYKNIYQATGEFGRYKDILKWNTILTFIMVVILLGCIKSDSYIIFLMGYTIVNIVIWVGTEKKIGLAHLALKFFDYKEFVSEIKSGFFLMLGNFSSILLTSMDRWFIKVLFDTLSFAEYSFAVSMENLVNVAITPVTTTLYNYFCNNNEYSKIIVVRRYVTMFSVLITACVFPIQFIVNNFILKYCGSMRVLFLLFAGHILYVPIKGVYVNLYKVEKRQNQYFRGVLFVVIIGGCLNVVLFFLLHNKEAFAIGTLLSAFAWYIICCIDFRNMDFPIREMSYSIIEIFLLVMLGCFLNPFLGCIFYMIGTIVITFLMFKKEGKALIKLLADMLKDKIKNNS